MSSSENATRMIKEHIWEPLEAGTDRAKKIIKMAIEARKEISGPGIERGPKTMHARNKARTCPAQIRDALLQIMEENGGDIPHQDKVPKRLSLAATYHFGSWNKMLRALGLSGRAKWEVYSDEELLGNLRNLARALGRSPSSNDCGGEFPGKRTYVRRFGSWSNAKKLAGV